MWVQLHDSARDHPKLIKAARDLGMPKVHLLGHLASFWTWVLRMAPDGDLSSFDHEDIEIGAEWEGDSGALVSTLVKRGFLDEGPSGLVVHDWDSYAEHLKARKRKREERARKRQNEEGHMTSRDVTGPVRNSGHVTQKERKKERKNRASHVTPAKNSDAESTWSEAITTTADLAAAAAEWGWSVSLSSSDIQRGHSVLSAGPIPRGDYLAAKERVDSKPTKSPVKYFLGCVEGMRSDVVAESRRATAQPQGPPPPFDADVRELDEIAVSFGFARNTIADEPKRLLAYGKPVELRPYFERYADHDNATPAMVLEDLEREHGKSAAT
jgi:hypothetical protein